MINLQNYIKDENVQAYLEDRTGAKIYVCKVHLAYGAFYYLSYDIYDGESGGPYMEAFEEEGRYTYGPRHVIEVPDGEDIYTTKAQAKKRIDDAATAEVEAAKKIAGNEDLDIVIIDNRDVQKAAKQAA